GSAGLLSGDDQPSVPSFEYYQIRRPMLSWEIEERRFVIQRSGGTRAHFHAEADKKMIWPCYSSRAERILAGITRLFANRQVGAQCWYTEKGARTVDCLVAGYTFSDDATLGIAADRLRLQRSPSQDWQRLWQGHTPERLMDLTGLV